MGTNRLGIVALGADSQIRRSCSGNRESDWKGLQREQIIRLGEATAGAESQIGRGCNGSRESGWERLQREHTDRKREGDG